MRELPVVRVACAAYKPESGEESLGKAIRARFERVQAWLQEIGYDPYRRLTIGSIMAAEDQLLRYECCIEVPDEVQSAPEGIRIKKLPGGKYAVVTIAKDPQLIPETVHRFHEEYAPQNSIQMDAARPTYEIYFEDVMEYCVPVL
jgi:DNA gyrase inhibitor GyrI